MSEASLRDLGPNWVYRNGRIEGVRFGCPACDFTKVSHHQIKIVWIAPSIHTSGCVWTKVSGDSFDNLTVVPSIDCTENNSCKFHGFITNGKVTW